MHPHRHSRAEFDASWPFSRSLTYSSLRYALHASKHAHPALAPHTLVRIPHAASISLCHFRFRQPPTTTPRVHTALRPRPRSRATTGLGGHVERWTPVLGIYDTMYILYVVVFHAVMYSYYVLTDYTYAWS